MIISNDLQAELKGEIIKILFKLGLFSDSNSFKINNNFKANARQGGNTEKINLEF